MTTFKNLFESVYNEKLNNLKRGYAHELEKINNNDFTCYYNSRCYARLKAYKRGQITIEQFKKSIINCYEKDIKNLKEKIKNEFNFTDNVEVSKITLNVEWKRNATWGMNPTCEAVIDLNYNDESGARHTRTYYTASASGCGYDKQSASVASALNQCDALKRLMYEIKEKYLNENPVDLRDADNLRKLNRDIFGYGSGYGITPYFEGGVGMSSLCTIIKNLGFEQVTDSHGKTFDCYTFIKK